MDSCLRDVLRRQRRVRHHGRRMRVRRPVRRRVRDADGGAEHGAVQRRRVVRRLLHHRLRRPQDAVVQARDFDHCDGDQLLPAQLRPVQRRRRVVQPAAAPLRHVAAGVGDDRRVPRRDRPRQLPPRAVPAERRHPVCRERAQLLRAGARDQRRRQRRRGADVDQGVQDGVDGDEPQLGRELAEQRAPRRAEPVVPGAVRRRPRRHGGRRRAGVVVVRRDLHVRCSVLLTQNHQDGIVEFLFNLNRSISHLLGNLGYHLIDVA